MGIIKTTIKLIVRSYFGMLLFSCVKQVYQPSEKVLKKLKFKGKFKVKTSKNNQFYLYNNAFNLETHIFWLGLEKYQWELTTRKLWVHLAQQSEIVFDIGANTGVFSVLAKAHNPNAKVTAFEPQPNVFGVLQKNNTINNYDINCENCALSNRADKMRFYNYGPNAFTTSNTTAGSLNKQWREENQSSIMVDVQTLNQYIEKNKTLSIDLMKIDVETFEYEVLKGYDKFIYQHSPILILEIQDKEIGQKIASLFDLKTHSFFYIDENKGIIKTENLGREKEFYNYLICPNSKLEKLANFDLI